MKLETKFLIYKGLVQFTIFAPLTIPFFTEVAKLRTYQFLVLQTVYQYATMFAEVPTGVLGDRYSRKLSIIIGNMIFGLGAFFYSFLAGSYIVFIVGEILMGIGTAFISGADNALIYDSFKELRQEDKYFLYLTKSIKLRNFMTILTSFLGIFIVKLGLLRWIFAIYGIVLFIAALFLCLFIKEPRIMKTKNSVNYKSIIVKSIENFKVSKNLRFWALVSFVVNVLVYYTFWLGQNSLTSFKIPTYLFPMFSATIASCNIILHHFLPQIRKFLTDSKLFKILAIIQFVAFILLLILFWLTIKMGVNLGISILILSLTALIGSIFSLVRPVITDKMQKDIPSNVRATMLSFVSFGSGMIRGTLNPLLGYISDIHPLMVLFSILGLQVVVNINLGKNDS